MKSNFLLILEVTIAILFIYLLLSYKPNFYYDIRGFREEDLLSSLISINYLNLSNVTYLENYSCQIASNILDYYKVLVNGSLACNNTDEDLRNSIRTFYIINGTPILVEIFLK